MDGIYHKVQELKSAGQTFALATVIAVRGSASAKPGSKAVFDHTGRNLLGWVGGGCAESFIGSQSKEAIIENQTRIVTANLDDEVFGLGMPCGGVMDVFIEPFLPPVSLTLPRAGRAGTDLRLLAESLGFVVHESEETKIFERREELITTLVQAMGRQRQTTLGSLKNKRVPNSVSPRNPLPPNLHKLSELLILGNSRITEELASFGAFLGWPTRVFGPRLRADHYPDSVTLESLQFNYDELQIKPNSAVVVASHHKGDHEFIRNALKSRTLYLGLVASPKRSNLVLDFLRSTNPAAEDLTHVFAPAGLDIHCLNPREIALSICAEIITLLPSHGDLTTQSQ